MSKFIINLKSIVFIFCLLILSCKEETVEFKEQKIKVSIDKVRWVTSKSGLRFRRNPGLSAERLGLIKYNEKVIFIEEEKNEIVVAGKKGKWTKINYNNITGWVFGAFLSKHK